MKTKTPAVTESTTVAGTRPIWFFLPGEPEVPNASHSFRTTPEAGPGARHGYLLLMQFVNIFARMSTLSS